jgi:hypothetical protein
VNILTFTQELDNAAWTKTGLTATANTAVAPDTTNTADTLTASAGTSARNISQSGGGSGSALTLSVYAKAGTSNFIQLFHGSGSTIFADFNLASGVVGTVGAGATAAIASAGDGWYRCSITFTPGTASASRVAMVSSATAVYNESWTAAGTETILLWGAQLEVGSTATTYTRNFGGLFPPRFDYNPVTLVPRGLLIEAQRTNLRIYSEQFDNAAWAKTGATVTANATTSPDGTVNADSLIEDTATSAHETTQSGSLTAAAHTFSAFVKANGRSWVRLFIFQSGLVGASVWFNVATGVVGTVGSGATNATITNFGNGWYRCSFTFTALAVASTSYIQLATADNGASSYTGDGTSGIFVWGAQTEVGGGATSYIPTVASQVTRAGDVANISAPNFAPWYNQSEGTLVAEYSSFATTAATSKAVTASYDGTGNNRLMMYLFTSAPAFTATVGGVSQALLSTAGVTANSVVKSAVAFRANDFAFSTNGSAALTDTSGSLPVTNALAIGSLAGSIPLNGHVRRIVFYPTRLSNAQIQALST